jgi:hypothetical protein
MLRLLLLTVLALLLAAPAAQADTRGDILRDCRDNSRLDGSYTPSEIRDARSHIPADVDQYSDCRDVLGRALGGSGDKAVGGGTGGGGGGAGGGGGGALGGGGLAPGAAAEPLQVSGPEEQQALDAAALQGGDKAVQVGDGTVVPGASGAVRNVLPPSLLAALILLGVAAAAATVPSVRRRVLARRLA